MTQITRVNINDYTASTRRTIMLWHRATVNGSTPHCSALTFSLKYSELFSVLLFSTLKVKCQLPLVSVENSPRWSASRFSDVHSPNFSTKRSGTSFRGAGSRPTKTALFPRQPAKLREDLCWIWSAYLCASEYMAMNKPYWFNSWLVGVWYVDQTKFIIEKPPS